MSTAVRNDCGQHPVGPSGVAAQSKARMSVAIAPLS
jgi:hypothetical protein